MEHSILLVNVVLGAAALVASVTGFGYALVATPFLILLYPPAQAVPLVLISWFPIAIFLVYGSRKHLLAGRIVRLLAGGFIGAPLGMYSLASLADSTMQSVIGAITLVAIASMAVRTSAPLTREGRALVGAGFLSGILGGASGLSGPPIVLLGLRQRWEHESFRATLLCYFFVLHTMISAIFGNVGMLTGDTLGLSLRALPGIVAGFISGMWLKDRVDAGMYRRLAMGLVVAGGLLALFVQR
ncbi:MAG TPA: sulfite exporter TauE/SafE family protein [Candidatus Handelsmanbacteria bacterium]|nr:sulfite exporter TauE/SafE family protein [Candidatus Handelsmanbacteria bacterium]